MARLQELCKTLRKHERLFNSALLSDLLANRGHEGIQHGGEQHGQIRGQPNDSSGALPN